MSATQDPGPTVECTYPDCTEFGPVWEFHHGEYCSTECELKDNGRDAIAHLLYDHCVCATCFHDLKEIDPPKEDGEYLETGSGWTRDEDGNIRLEVYRQEESRRAAVGREFLTPHATKGEKNRQGLDRVITGTICDHCGNTDHTHHDTILATAGAIERLAERLLEDDDTDINPVELCIAYSTERDLDLAVGRALYD